MGAKRVFIDTAAWVAFVDKNDQFHHEAAHHFKSIYLKKDLLYTSNLVIYETLTLLTYKVSHRVAIHFIDILAADQRLSTLFIDPGTEYEAFQLFKKYSDQKFSMVDCTSFAFMKRHAIHRAFSFDKHFKIAGFKLEPV